MVVVVVVMAAVVMEVVGVAVLPVVVAVVVVCGCFLPRLVLLEALLKLFQLLVCLLISGVATTVGRLSSHGLGRRRDRHRFHQGPLSFLSRIFWMSTEGHQRQDLRGRPLNIWAIPLLSEALCEVSAGWAASRMPSWAARRLTSWTSS